MENIGLFNKVIFSAAQLQQNISAATSSHTKTQKEKRERQPNWTEAEKLYLLSLTNRHRSILENKGSDGLTIKKKSEAWDDIALNMKAAGYHRSKERLKQQLGRIKSAEAKRAKDALAKRMANISVCSEQLTDNSENQEHNTTYESQEDYTGSNLFTKSINGDQDQENEVHIKIERAVSIKEFEDSLVTCEPFQFNEVTDHFNKYNNEANKDANEGVSSNVLYLKQKCEELTVQTEERKKVEQSIKRKKVRTRIHNMHELQKYRIAIERERLRALRLQRKRDKLLYRKDVQIQNLKMQILQNLSNQNCSNHINF